MTAIDHLGPQWGEKDTVLERSFPMSRIIAQQNHMEEVLASDRVSETPDAPVWLKRRSDAPGMFEMADGHHRVASALRRGETTIPAELDRVPDDEPLREPFYRFPGEH